MAVAAKKNNISSHPIRSPSIVKLQQYLQEQFNSEVSAALNKTHAQLEQEEEENKENVTPLAQQSKSVLAAQNKRKKAPNLTPSLTTHAENAAAVTPKREQFKPQSQLLPVPLTTPSDSACTNARQEYRMPLQFIYHKHRFLFMDSACVDKTILTQFHRRLQKYPVSIKERYGWSPSFEERMSLDLNADLLGVAINDADGSAEAMIEFFDVSDAEDTKYDIEKELALIVLPPFQRRHIATDLVRLSWNLLADHEHECWIYVLNSNKSGMFWRRFKQWYPSVMFRLVRP